MTKREFICQFILNMARSGGEVYPSHVDLSEWLWERIIDKTTNDFLDIVEKEKK